MDNLQKHLIHSAFLSTPASDVHERLKTLTAQRLKLQVRLLTVASGQRL